MDITEHTDAKEQRFIVTASLTHTQYSLLRGNVVDVFTKMLVDNLINEFLPDVRAKVLAKLDYIAIAQQVQTAINARLLEEMLRGTIKHA